MPATVTFSEELIENRLVVDVRTPLEFHEDHIPGSVNVPLLSNDERVEIGTLYKQQGAHIARIRGLELTAARFPEIVADISGHADGREIVVCCWRGGLRSKTVATILELTGYKAFQLTGGYKSFRNQVSGYFEPFSPTSPLVIIHGMTGIGKTTFLKKLEERGFAVIDLEGEACHRGSAFGELGLSQEHLTQKNFESALWDRFRKIPSGVPIILEGESRRIGKLFLPGNLYDVMHKGVKVWCTASMQTRVERLIEEYGKPEFSPGMADSLGRISKKLGGDNYRELMGLLERREMKQFMEQLMERYYDKNYYKTRDWKEAFSLSLEDFDKAADELTTNLISSGFNKSVNGDCRLP